MKPKILLLGFIFTAGCFQSKASGIENSEPGKPVNEVSGNIIDADSKKPLKEVTITAYLVNKKEKFVVSDELGHFDMDELKSGTYRLVFEKGGYHRVVREKVVIKTDETFQLRIEMIEDEDFDLVPSPFQFFKTK